MVRAVPFWKEQRDGPPRQLFDAVPEELPEAPVGELNGALRIDHDHACRRGLERYLERGLEPPTFRDIDDEGDDTGTARRDHGAQRDLDGELRGVRSHRIELTAHPHGSPLRFLEVCTQVSNVTLSVALRQE
jgi:hypothetical protein